jgi:hypothetical protein
MNHDSPPPALNENCVAASTPNGKIHPLVSRTQDVLEGQQPNEHHMLYAVGHGTLHVRVSRRLMRRSLRILNAIVNACEAREWKVDPTNDGGISRITIGEDPVSFSLYEKIRRCDMRFSESHAESVLWRPRYCYGPTGLLALQICEDVSADLRRHWSDGRKQRLEDLLGQFIEHLKQVALALRRRRLAQEEWNCRWAAYQHERDHAARVKQETEAKEDLLRQATSSQQAAALRQMISEVRRRSVAERTIWPRERIERWLCRAEALAQTLDPFANGNFDRALGQFENGSDAAPK